MSKRALFLKIQGDFLSFTYEKYSSGDSPPFIHKGEFHLNGESIYQISDFISSLIRKSEQQEIENNYKKAKGY